MNLAQEFRRRWGQWLFRLHSGLVLRLVIVIDGSYESCEREHRGNLGERGAPEGAFIDTICTALSFFFTNQNAYSCRR